MKNDSGEFKREERKRRAVYLAVVVAYFVYAWVDFHNQKTEELKIQSVTTFVMLFVVVYGPTLLVVYLLNKKERP